MKREHHNGRPLTPPNQIEVILSRADAEGQRKLELIEGGWDPKYRRTRQQSGQLVRLDLLPGAATELLP